VENPLRYDAVLARMQEDLTLRGLAPNTLDSYLRSARIFLAYSRRPVEQLDTLDIRQFLLYLIREKTVAPATVNTYSAAIRFLFAVTLNRPLNYLQIPRQKAPKVLPALLSRAEITAILDHCANLKHRALLTLIYGSGLRVSEAAALTVDAIDSPAGRVFVAAGKGHKDRYTVLSQKSLAVLRDYWRAYRPHHPDHWVFPSSAVSGHITADGIRWIFDSAVQRAQITTSVSIHTLRHCFATHLLEDGATLLQIKELLGHSSIQSTTVYLHLASLTTQVGSPLDRFPPAGPQVTPDGL
jgi:site-specific recombinase XerD